MKHRYKIVLGVCLFIYSVSVLSTVNPEVDDVSVYVITLVTGVVLFLRGCSED